MAILVFLYLKVSTLFQKHPQKLTKIAVVAFYELEIPYLLWVLHQQLGFASHFLPGWCWFALATFCCVRCLIASLLFLFGMVVLPTKENITKELIRLFARFAWQTFSSCVAVMIAIYWMYLYR